MTRKPKKKKWLKKEVDAARAYLEKKYGPFWHEDPEDLRRLALYCGRDVLAEHALSSALADPSPEELKVFQITNAMNWRGVYCDLDAARAAIEVMADLKQAAEAELSDLTEGQVSTVNQGARIQAWALDQGYPLANCRKVTIVDALADDKCPEHVKKVLKIRQLYGRSSITKYQAIVDRADPEDWRVRDHQRHHGARTGRIAAQGIQTHNFPRPDPGIKFDQILQAIRAVKLRDPDFFSCLFENPAAMLSAATRPTIQAAPGKMLYAIDWTSIEAVLTLWFCDDPGIELIRNGLCVYRDLAGEIYGLDDPQSLPKGSSERSHGKVGVLSCGYGAGAKTVKRSAKEQWGLDLPLKFVEKMVKAYRTKYPQVPAMWKKLQRGFLQCVWNQVDVDIHKGVGFEWGSPFCKLRLMSGRKIYYYKPEIKMIMAPWGEETPAVFYWGENSQTKQWELLKTYGGMLLNHVIQGSAHDLMRIVMAEADDNPWLGDLVMTVHDELVFEIDEELNPERACEETCEIMKNPPPWAPDCPIGVG